MRGGGAAGGSRAARERWGSRAADWMLRDEETEYQEAADKAAEAAEAAEAAAEAEAEVATIACSGEPTWAAAEQEECAALLRTACLQLMRRLSRELLRRAPTSTPVPLPLHPTHATLAAAAAAGPRTAFGHLLSSLQTELDAGVPVGLLQAHGALLAELGARTGGTDAPRAAASLARDALSRYKVSQPAALQTLLGLLLARTCHHLETAQAAADVAEAALRPQAADAADASLSMETAAEAAPQGIDGGRADSGGTAGGAGAGTRRGTVGEDGAQDGEADGIVAPLQLGASRATRAAALKTALVRLQSLLEQAPSRAPSTSLASLLECLRRALDAVFAVTLGSGARGAWRAGRRHTHPSPNEPAHAVHYKAGCGRHGCRARRRCRRHRRQCPGALCVPHCRTRRTRHRWCSDGRRTASWLLSGRATCCPSGCIARGLGWLGRVGPALAVLSGLAAA